MSECRWSLDAFITPGRERLSAVECLLVDRAVMQLSDQVSGPRPAPTALADLVADGIDLALQQEAVVPRQAEDLGMLDCPSREVVGRNLVEGPLVGLEQLEEDLLPLVPKRPKLSGCAAGW